MNQDATKAALAAVGMLVLLASLPALMAMRKQAVAAIESVAPENKTSLAPDLRGLGINLVTAGVIGALVDDAKHRPLHVTFAVAGVLLFWQGKVWENQR